MKWLEALARAAYSLLLRLLAPLYVLRLWRRGRVEPLYRHEIAERFGVYRSGADRAGQGRQSAQGGQSGQSGQGAQPGWLWVHAVSLGETRAAAALIEALRAERPGMRLLLTHGTATGREAGRRLLNQGDAQAWLPYDTSGATGRFLAHFQPAVGVLMETEVWPNLLHAAQRRGVPMVLANARLSERSAARGRRVSLVLRPAAQSLTLVLAQTDEDAERLRAAGARTVEVGGNLKYDLTPDPALLARGAAWRAALARQVVLAAVTREGEEAELLDAWRRHRPAGALLLIVPRHPQRFDEVGALVRAAGLTLARRSQWGKALTADTLPAATLPAGTSPAEALLTDTLPAEALLTDTSPAEVLPADMPPAEALTADAWLGDSMGEMALYYASADVALLGGSFAPFGGQNLIEAAACACPLVMGPSTFNFDEAASLSLAAGASLRVADLEQGVVEVRGLLQQPQRLAPISQAALAFAAGHRGAAVRMARRILQIVHGA